MVLRHYIAWHEHQQDALHDGLAAEHQEVSGGRCQPECDYRGNIDPGHPCFRAKLGALPRLGLAHETLAMEVDSRLQGKDKDKQTHADDKAAFQQVAMSQTKNHVPIVIQKQ